jgi:hypothetical protein
MIIQGDFMGMRIAVGLAMGTYDTYFAGVMMMRNDSMRQQDNRGQ